MMLNLFRHEVMYYFKNRKEIIEIYVLIFTLNILVYFASSHTLTANHELTIATIWVSIVAASALAAHQLFERDSSSGKLELLQMLPCGLEQVILAKYLSFYLLMLGPAFLLLPFIAAIFPQLAIAQTVCGMAVGTAGICAIQLLAAAFMAGRGKSAAFLGLISLPMVVPLVIFGAAYLRQSVLWHETLAIMLAYALFIVPLMCLAAASVIRNGH